MVEGRREAPLSLYVHVPWCRARCGYCDFNTYVSAPQPGYLAALHAELGLAAAVVGPRRVDTVYFGGGTPTLLPPADFAALLVTIRERFDLDPGAEVTTEANPETLSPEYVERLRAAGVTRLSLGFQSAVPHVLATLDRVHTPGRALDAVTWARRAGFESVSLDLIYGTPGESLDDWRATLDAAVAARPDHISAYALIVEEGTRLAARMKRGELPYPDDDLMADQYLLADQVFERAGWPWYELSNWGEPCRHNLAYWLSEDWWGVGAGAHSHVGGIRWWNWRLPAAYAARLPESPAEAREVLSADQRRMERVLLELRLASGLDESCLTASERGRVAGFVEAGLVALRGGRVVLTPPGRLLADAVTRELLD
ncbi:MAG: radical SAM family heme chaperone HemW [Propionibacteriaceae bacterium]|nr:radical SAM family heme chaperone HemW [Propionibacteriaceae bacterium]